MLTVISDDILSKKEKNELLNSSKERKFKVIYFVEKPVKFYSDLISTISCHLFANLKILLVDSN